MDKEQGQGQLTVYLTTFLTNLVFTRIFMPKLAPERENTYFCSVLFK